MLTPGPNDIAIVAEGGAGLIYQEAAALQMLMGYDGIAKNVKGIYGNSTGAILATGLAAGLYHGVGTQLLIDALSSVKENGQIYSPDVVAIMHHPWLHPISETQVFNGLAFGESGLDQQPLWDLLKQHYGDLHTRDIWEKLGIEVLVRGFDPVGKRGRVLSGKLWRIAAASSAMEVFFKPHLGISDGGPSDNFPVDLAINAGFRRILMLYSGTDNPPVIDEPMELDDDTPQPPTIPAKAVAFSLIDTLTSRNEDIAEERLMAFTKNGGQVVESYAAQGTDLGNIFDFSPEAQAIRTHAGYAAGTKALEDAKKLGW